MKGQQTAAPRREGEEAKENTSGSVGVEKPAETNSVPGAGPGGVPAPRGGAASPGEHCAGRRGARQ